MMKETNQFKMETANTRTKSLLAQALTDAIASTGYSREDWTFILDVSESAISQWLSDTTLPRPEMLRMIVDTLRESASVSPEILTGFDALMHRPAVEISPHGTRMGGSLAKYLTRPLREGLLRELDALPDERQEEVLAAASRLCHDAMRQRAAVRPTVVSNTVTTSSATANEADGISKPPSVTQADLMALTREPVDPHPTAWVVPGSRQVALIEGQRHLRLVDQEPSFNIISGMFSASNEQQSAMGEDELLTCAVVIWRFPPSISDFPAYLLEELQVFLYSGRIRVTLAGQQKSIILGDGPGDSNLMWLTAGRKNELGLPSFKCETLSEEPAIGIAVLYDPQGVRLHPAADQSKSPYLVMPEWVKWDTGDAEQYWKDLRDEIGDITDRLPMVGRVPTDRGALHNMIEEHPLSPDEQIDPHYEARCKNQVFDANLPGWSVPENAALYTRLIRFPECPGINEENIHGASHPGQEIFIPLHGAFNCVYASLTPRELERGRFDMGFIPFNRRRRKTVQSTSVSRQKFPDIFSVNSESAHGFYGANGDGYCLHIRCLPDMTRFYAHYREANARKARQARKAKRSTA
jgi:hypothetical protein